MKKSLMEIAQSFNTDKKQSTEYIRNFEFHFKDLRDKPIKILELGVFRGGSLLMWQEYFSKGLIVGLDLKKNPLTETIERVRFFQGSQDDTNLLDRMSSECAPDGFDIIVDDASHVGILARASFNNLFTKHLKSGGIYVIEDWGTGYWNSWPDGKEYRATNQNQTFIARKIYLLLRRLAVIFRIPKKYFLRHQDNDPNFAMHNFGMVGFIKELIDEIAWLDITSPNRGTSSLPSRPSAISQMTIYCGHAFIVKA